MTLDKRAKRQDTEKCSTFIQCAAGAPIPRSGIYILQHTCSRSPQQVVAVTGDRLPACPDCFDGGKYVLERAAPHLTEDPDFKAQS